MIRSLRDMAVFVTALFVGSSPTPASVLTFDDLGSGSGFFLSDYNGFTFGTNNMQTTAWFHTDEVSPLYTPISGSIYLSTDFQLYSGQSFEATQPIRRSTAFVFDGAYFSGGGSIGYQLYLNGALVFTSSASASLTANPTFVASGYGAAVDAVVVSGRQGYYALDDFTYHAVGSPAPVPEPALWAMMVLGFGVLGTSLRVHKRSIAYSGLRTPTARSAIFV